MASLDDLDDVDPKDKKASLDDLDSDGDAGGDEDEDGEGEDEEEFNDNWEDDGTKVFMICPPGADWKSGSPPVVVSSVAKPYAQRKIEQAGMEYHRRVMNKKDVQLKDQRGAATADGAAAGGDAAPAKPTLTKAHLKFLEDDENELTDFYGLLGVTPEEVEIDESVVGKAYRVLSMLMHPDKATPERREFAEERFKAIQKAHTTLSDTQRRHTYFSTLDFDDSVPTEKQGLGDKFFTVYGPVFQRNSCFSSVRPVPQLGSMESTYDYVNDFYDFWLSFKSFRDFAADDEKDTANASDRFEKRMMEKENAKKRAAAKKDEITRLRKFVEDAMKKDPRIARQKQIEAEEKAAKKKAKADARLAEEQKKRDAEEAEKKRIADAKAAEEEEKKKKAAVQQQLKKLRSGFKKLTSREPLSKLITADEAETISNRLEYDAMVKLMDSVAPKSSAIHTATELAAATAALTEIVAEQKGLEKKEKDRLADDAARAKMLERKKLEDEAAKKEWSLEEISLLAKAIAKYPGAHPARWGQIQTMVNTLGGDRSVKEVMLKSKEDLRAPGKNSVTGADAFSTYQSSVSQKKLKHEIPDGDYAAPADLLISSKIGSANQKTAPAAAAAASTTAASTATAAAPAPSDAGPKAWGSSAPIAPSDAGPKPWGASAPVKAPSDSGPKPWGASPAGVTATKSNTAAAAAPAAAAAKKPTSPAAPAATTPVSPAGASAKPKGPVSPAGGAAKASVVPAAAAMPAAATSSSAASAAAAKKKAADAAAAAAAAEAVAALDKNTTDSSDVWKSEEQFLLEQGLRTVSKDDAERWEKIAAHVKTKNKKQCMARFNEIRAEVIRKKQAAEAAAAKSAPVGGSKKPQKK